MGQGAGTPDKSLTLQLSAAEAAEAGEIDARLAGIRGR